MHRQLSMNNHLASRSKARSSIVSSLFGVAAVCSLLGCGLGAGKIQIGVVETALDDKGVLHVVSRIEQGVSEGSETAFHGFAYTRAGLNGYESFSNLIGYGEVTENDARMYQLALDGEGRPVIAVETDDGLVVARFQDNQWTTLSFDPSMPEAVLADLGSSGQLGAAWTASDGTVRVMYGQAIYEVKDAVFRYKALEMGCFLVDDCIFDPQGDDGGEAVRFDWNTKGFELSRLSCDSFCSWKTVGSIGSKDQGGSSAPLTRFLFHTSDGKARFLQKIEPLSGAPEDAYKVVVSTLDEQTTLFERGIFRIGGAPRPAGGFAVAALGYDRQLHLAVVAADGEQKKIDLGDVALGSDPIRVRVSALPSEEVHVVTRESGDHLAHYVVSLPSGEYTKESIPVEWQGPTYE